MHNGTINALQIYPYKVARRSNILHTVYLNKASTVDLSSRLRCEELPEMLFFDTSILIWVHIVISHNIL
jgi:hypothetical protein